MRSNSACLAIFSVSLFCAASSFLLVSASYFSILALFSASNFSCLIRRSSANFSSLCCFSSSLYLSRSYLSWSNLRSFSSLVLWSSFCFSSLAWIFSFSSRSFSSRFSSLLRSNSYFLYSYSSSFFFLRSMAACSLAAALCFFSISSCCLLSTTGLHFGQYQSASSSFDGSVNGRLFFLQYLCKHFSMWNDLGQLSQQISSPPSLQTLQWSRFSILRFYLRLLPSVWLACMEPLLELSSGWPFC